MQSEREWKVKVTEFKMFDINGYYILQEYDMDIKKYLEEKFEGLN